MAQSETEALMISSVRDLSQRSPVLWLSLKLCFLSVVKLIEKYRTKVAGVLGKRAAKIAFRRAGGA